MLENDMYDSWKSIMELYMLNRQHGRMILESVENGPLLWPIVEENKVTRLKKYSELSATKAIQADLVHQQSDFSQLESGLVVLVFQKGDDPIYAISHMMSFLTAVVTSRETKGIVCYNCKGEGEMSKQCIKPRGKEMRRGLRIRSRDNRDSKHTIALMANSSHYGSDNLAE
nr:hypothetical protein [Tanacetum cinerariifolium]